MDDLARPDDTRVSDADRRAVQDRLQWAHGEGLLDLNEFDVRTRAVWDSKTRGELARLTGDLPARPRHPGRRRVFSDTGGGTAMRVLTIVFGSIAAVNLIVWGLVVLTIGGWVYPWWVWTVAPPGAVLGVLYLSGIGRPDRD
ncbi:DUF1707 SHOCT-like domain-containing protein [Pseudonocardia asaccharolytica]|uniref:DUF1707 SHOCT-like domain-containing protein n=1 Tax=Pseudonocardia asaccharolytica TaxID=54010 RepID=UPI000408B020|nr:DUF1707 domain-containing protein [Pseudonocardia asaccharolytica]